MNQLRGVDFLIFDLGNVIIDIDYEFSMNELRKLLPAEKHPLVQQFFPSKFHKDYEKGLITSSQFRDAVRELYQENWTDAQIDYVWNSLLRELPQERLDLVARLREEFGTGVLSNTNEIHILKMNEILQEKAGIPSMHVFCDHVFLSHEMGLAKPDEAIYKAVIEQIGIPASKVLFFDDLPANLEGAKRVGLKTFHIHHPKALIEFFSDVQ